MSKYKSFKTIYNGIWYDSKKEADRAKVLDALHNALDSKNRVLKVERQVPFRIAINNKHITTYYLDFRVTYADGRIEYEDVKGVKTPVYCLKKKLVEAVYGFKIKEV